MRTIARKLAKNDSGAAAVEFALIAPIMLLMVLIITELGKIVYYRSVLESAARSGTQAGMASTVSYASALDRANAEEAMETAAELAIANSGIGGTVTPTAVVTCECSGALGVEVPACTCALPESVRYIATVTMTRPYVPLLADLIGYFNLAQIPDLTGNSIMWVR